jgi:hypothetical protein
MNRILVVGIIMLATAAQATYLIGRSGTVMKPLQVFGWVNGGYSQTGKAYDWDSTRYLPLATGAKTATTGAEITAAIGLPGRLEFGATAPVLLKRLDTLDASGLGDVMLHLRYGILQSKLLPVKIAATVGANLPTSPKDAVIALNDRTFDVGIGLAAVTSSFAKLAFHGRAGYWLNGKSDSITRVGNQLEYLAVADYAVCKCLIPELSLSGMVSAGKQVRDSAVGRTESSIHSAGLLLMFKPIPQLALRPKVSMPLEFVSKGSKIAPFMAGLDVWATLP